MWISVVVMLVGALVVAEVGRRAASGTLPRNHVAGIRVPSTMRDDESWRIAHLAGGPAMMITGVLSTIITLVAAVAGVVSGDGVAMAIVLVAAGIMLVGVLWSGWLGLSALRRRRT